MMDLMNQHLEMKGLHCIISVHNQSNLEEGKVLFIYICSICTLMTGRLLHDVTTCSVNINFQKSNYHLEFEFNDLPTISVEKKVHEPTDWS